ncbi:TrkH family potassium uptake protein [Rhodalgimonas zhirmunskyi]|uniref:TrkH family potassium uptake protein n=1 Tax=Rhodalgimonas zhirmunskyi TaxID=2964767 RepID=A0AAJ1UA63_9RHOB|nr:potassium transporter TrkG [Rhodoalgimonas zhirmunskyi]MDQ2092816.1 TrkH family potassium uptake protein [Rhodoalgimonas zhirmunskyi]
MGVMALGMLIPAVHALAYERFLEARSFFYASVLGLFAMTIITITTSGRPRRSRGGLTDLLALFAAFAVLPIFLAWPFYEALRTTFFINAYFEMVSALTTTGATMFAPERLSDTLHLWRGMVGWFGGLIMWVAAVAILAPLNLGGFEVTASAEPGQGGTPSERYETSGVNRRLQRALHALLPVYGGLTAVIWLCLIILGDRAEVALIHAMSTMATSGISPLGGVEQAGSGLAGEAVIFLFMFFALSRLTFSSDTLTGVRPGLLNDPEFRIGLLIIVGVPLLLFARHWIGAFELDDEENVYAAGRALWGSIFTVMSFLTTTGFESAGWEDTRNWSGLGTPGMILLGVALIGGGVATTAGGVKLLRVYALYLNGLREMEKLVHPSSVGRASSASRRIRRQGAFVAWIFFMLFAFSLVAVTTLFTLTGVDFENALVLAIASLSTCGPLVTAGAEDPIALAMLSDSAKLVFSAASVLGRLETLAIIALFNPALWRE